MARSVTNIQDAVSCLGISTLKSLFLSLEVFRAFAPKTSFEGFSLEDLQRHARLTSLIAARLPVPNHLVDIAMVAGMLHDVGKLVMAWKLPERFKKLLTEADEENCPLHVTEEREYGFSHAEIGAYLLGLWGLPYAVVEAIALHHAPRRAHTGASTRHRQFTSLTFLPKTLILPHPHLGWTNCKPTMSIWPLWEFKRAFLIGA